MSESPFMSRCLMCGCKYRMGPQIYNGKYIQRYQMGVCKTCYASNWDGWESESKLLSHLAEKNIPVPERNSKGLYPRD